MSLLMKALEKAAKDRGEARAEEPAKAELALEPMAAGAASVPTPASAPRAVAAPPREAAAASAAAPAANLGREQAQAAVVTQSAAGRSSTGGGGVGAYLSANPFMVLGTLAGLFVAAFGAYVYIQIFHPGLLAGRPPIAPNSPPIAQAPAVPVRPAAVPAEPLPSAVVLKDAAAAAEITPRASEATPRTRPLTTPVAQPEESSRGNTIVVSRGSPEPVLSPVLAQAYAALQSDQLETARSLYQKMLASDARNIDALLGLAAIAGRQGNTGDATRLYLRILELDPRHALAQSGLIALLGRADPLAAESRLKQLIAREPSAYLYFTLGNLYADQSQWAAAQQSYFQAHHLEATNPDYAYNLAVGLEHVSQPKLALDLYRRAVQLAGTKGRANFDSTLAQARIGKLARQVE